MVSAVQKELPQFQTYYEQHQSDDVSLVTVNLMNAERNKNTVQNFVSQHHLTFPIVLDTKGELMKEYDVMTIPTSFLLNEKGEIEKDRRSDDRLTIKRMVREIKRCWRNSSSTFCI